MAKKAGRKKQDIDWRLLDAILSYNATLTDAAKLLGCNTSTLEKAIKRVKKMNFSEYREQQRGQVKIKLIGKALDMAFKGNATMCIFCLKNLAGWTDKVETPDKDKDKDKEKDGEGTVLKLAYSIVPTASVKDADSN